jgi:hypothetical protein
MKPRRPSSPRASGRSWAPTTSGSYERLWRGRIEVRPVHHDEILVGILFRFVEPLSFDADDPDPRGVDIESSSRSPGMLENLMTTEQIASLANRPCARATGSPEKPRNFPWECHGSSHDPTVSHAHRRRTSYPRFRSLSWRSRGQSAFRPYEACRGRAKMQGNVHAVSSLSIVIGKSRTLLPVAWKIAFATAAAVPTMPISPRPFTPRGLTFSSCSSTKMTSICSTSA